LLCNTFICDDSINNNVKERGKKMSCGISVNDFKKLWERIHKKTKKKARNK